MTSQLSVSCKEVDPVINGGEQKQQMINVECVDDFVTSANLHIQFL